MAQPLPALLNEFLLFAESLNDFDGLEIEQRSPEKAWFGLPEGHPIYECAIPFMHIGDGSEILLLRLPDRETMPVCILHGEGEHTEIAGSLGNFLHLLAKADTDVHDLDDIGIPAHRKLLGAWLRAKGVKKKKAPAFNFQAFLSGEKEGAPTAEALSDELGELENYDPSFAEVAMLLGRRSDDPKVIEYCERVIGKTPPATVSNRKSSKHLSKSKAGIELLFAKDVLHPSYPRVAKSKSSFVPRIKFIYLYKKWPGKAPFGLQDIEETPYDENGIVIRQDIDKERGIVASSDGEVVWLTIKGGREIIPDWRPAAQGGLFLRWAQSRQLLDPAWMGGAEKLIGDSAMKAFEAMPQGIWDAHLKDLPGLRQHAFCYMNSVGSEHWFQTDLHKTFGFTKDAQFVEHAKLDIDDDAALKKITPVLDKRYGDWL